ncbi:MAG: hypothetical protein EOM87_05900 [Clostridia bacterium]|nr:hypothetical protein [Clostridia bacterium]
MHIEDRVRLSELLTEYGGLLTEKQKTILKEYCELDLSLFEIAEQYNITRQAVRDTVMRAEAQLAGYEKVLGVVELKAKLLKGLDEITNCDNCKDKLNELREMLEG